MNRLSFAGFAGLIRKTEPVLSEAWRSVLQEKHEELTRMFEASGDRAYGVWIQQFMEPVAAYIRSEGFIIKGGFNRNDSIERWGPPEERERCIWYAVKTDDNTPVGTLVLQVYHSHKSFHLPRAPRLLALEATDREAVIEALSHASARIRWDIKEERLPLPEGTAPEPSAWEYAADVSIGDCLAGADEDGQQSGWALDEALSHWGRYGWELVSVVPDGRRVAAFFKRRKLV